MGGAEDSHVKGTADQPTLDWKIYYHDLSTYSSDDGEWVEAPQEGVQLVVTKDPVYVRRWWSRHDFYVMHPQMDPAPLPVNDLYSQLIRWGIRPPSPFPGQSWLRDALGELGVLSFVKFGMALDQETWEKVSEFAVNDPVWPPGATPNRRKTDTEG